MNVRVANFIFASSERLFERATIQMAIGISDRRLDRRALERPPRRTREDEVRGAHVHR